MYVAIVAPNASLIATVLVIMKGDVSNKDFWSFDLQTGKERQLTRLRRGFVIGDFAVAPDGHEIVFDRTRVDSDIILFDLHGP